jgi:hypothetical protein
LHDSLSVMLLNAASFSIYHLSGSNDNIINIYALVIYFLNDPTFQNGIPYTQELQNT